MNMTIKHGIVAGFMFSSVVHADSSNIAWGSNSNVMMLCCGTGMNVDTICAHVLDKELSELYTKDEQKYCSERNQQQENERIALRRHEINKDIEKEHRLMSDVLYLPSSRTK